MDERELDEALEPLKRLLERRSTFTFSRAMSVNTKTFNKLEVKFMASIDFENLKQKITETANTVVEKTTAFAKDVAGKSSDAAKNVAGKAQTLAKKTKLNAEIAGERENTKKKYLELGKLYYEKYAGQTDPDFAGPVTAIEQSLERIAAFEAEIAALEAEPEVEVEVAAEEPDHIVDEVEKTVEAEAEAAVDAAEEAAEEAKRVYEDTVDSVTQPPQE